MSPDEKVNESSSGSPAANNIDVEAAPHTANALVEDGQNSLARSLKSRTCLLISSATALSRGGPASMLLAYSFVGLLVLNIMSALGEMAVFMPMDQGFGGYASRLVDPAFGYVTICLVFATGMNYFLKYVVLLANNLTASGRFMPVQYFGEVEFFIACIKTVTIMGLMILCLVIDLGGSPQGRLGFRYWKNPGAFKKYLETGPTGRFLGFWGSVANAAFAYMGSEMVGITFGEATQPWKTIPKAINAAFGRITIFLCWGRTSPFVVAIVDSGISTLPHIINGCLLVFVLSAANTDIYVASLNIDSGSARVFEYFVSLSTILGLLNWVSILVTHLFFQKGMEAREVSRDDLPFSGHFQKARAQITLFFTVLILLTSGEYRRQQYAMLH
ncbi:amino acid permease-domain-containing protein [Aspergillus pseudocaelatus]|uniref:Amino acid permease-domain-containing protein n=1 Tax=Aspergillus pseudocaelatus TaxID=1825620 RepID=A0ABQ6WUS6_9EURO|nr:amino acid permease-domain-containing protein [Aspergillus pseudocaelatus]